MMKINTCISRKVQIRLSVTVRKVSYITLVNVIVNDVNITD